MELGTGRRSNAKRLIAATALALSCATGASHAGGPVAPYANLFGTQVTLTQGQSFTFVGNSNCAFYSSDGECDYTFSVDGIPLGTLLNQSGQTVNFVASWNDLLGEDVSSLGFHTAYMSAVGAEIPGIAPTFPILAQHRFEIVAGAQVPLPATLALLGLGLAGLAVARRGRRAR